LSRDTTPGASPIENHIASCSFCGLADGFVREGVVAGADPLVQRVRVGEFTVQPCGSELDELDGVRRLGVVKASLLLIELARRLAP